jgi:hypothetical protein
MVAGLDDETKALIDELMDPETETFRHQTGNTD